MFRVRVLAGLILVLCGGIFLQAQEPAVLGTISVRASGEQKWKGDLWSAEGEVLISYQDVRIQCDRVQLNKATGDIEAEGHVILDQGPSRMSADSLRYNLRKKEGTFTNAKGSAPPSFSFTGDVIERLDQTHYKILNGTFTSCETEGRPPWDLHLREALIEEDGYGRFKGVGFRVKRVPVLYFPYLLWPMKRTRAAGFLVPSLGYSERRGFFIGNRLFIPLGRSYDTTLHFDYYSKAYYGFGTEFRWAPVEGALGQVFAYGVKDPVSGFWQWKIDGKHKQENFLGFNLLAEVHELSDNDFFQEFENTVQSNTRRSLYSQFFMTRSSGPGILNIRFDRRVTFLSTEDVTLHQLPEVEYRVRSTRVGNSSFFWNLITSANLFDVDRGGDLKGSYGRVDLFPEISYTVPGPVWLSMTPTIGGRETWYSDRYTDDRKGFEGESLNRSYYQAGLDLVGPSFSRIFDLHNDKGTRIKHLIEPRIEYNYLSDPTTDTSLLPVFDEVDSAVNTNRVKFTLSNRLYRRSNRSSSAEEFLSLDIFQEYSFDRPLSYGAEGKTSQRGPYGAALRFVPIQGATVDGRVSVDALSHKIRSMSLSTSMSRKVYNTGFTWYESYSPTTGDRTSSQAQVRFGLNNPDFPLKFDVQVAYDIQQKTMQQQRFSVGYTGSCWGVRAEYRNLQSAYYPARDYRIIFSLKGIGDLPVIKGSLSP